jgi:hypothetical protein
VIIHIYLLFHFLLFKFVAVLCSVVFVVVLCGVCWSCFSTVFRWFKLTYLPQLITDLMKTWTPTLQIRKYEDSDYFYLVIFVGTFMMPLYAINLGAARLFVDSPFYVFSNLEFVMIYVFSIWMNEYLFLVKKKWCIIWSDDVEWTKFMKLQ